MGEAESVESNDDVARCEGDLVALVVTVAVGKAAPLRDTVGV